MNSEFELTVTSITGSEKMCKFRRGANEFAIRISPGATGNCQLGVAFSFRTLINNLPPELYVPALAEIKDKALGKPLLLIDVKYEDWLKIRNHVDALNAAEYISSNKSRMVTAVLDLRF